MATPASAAKATDGGTNLRICLHNRFLNGYEEDHSPKSAVFGSLSPLSAARRIITTGVGSYEDSFIKL